MWIPFPSILIVFGSDVPHWIVTSFPAPITSPSVRLSFSLKIDHYRRDSPAELIASLKIELLCSYLRHSRQRKKMAMVAVIAAAAAVTVMKLSMIFSCLYLVLIT